MEGLLCNIIVDDIIVHGKNLEEHDVHLKQVINLKPKMQKCEFRVHSISFVGSRVFKSTSKKSKPFGTCQHQQKIKKYCANWG